MKTHPYFLNDEAKANLSAVAADHRAKNAARREHNAAVNAAFTDAARNTLATADARHSARRFSGQAITLWGAL